MNSSTQLSDPTLSRFERLIGLYIILIPWERVLDVALGVQTVLKPYRFIGILLVITGVWKAATRKVPLRTRSWDGLLVVLIGWGVVLAIFWSMVRYVPLSPTLVELYLIFAAYLPMAAATQHPLSHNINNLDRWITGFGSSLLASGVVASFFPSDSTRFSGMFGNPNAFGLCCAWVGLYAGIQSLLSPNLGAMKSTKWVALLFLAGWGTFVSGSRASILCFVLGFLFVFIKALRVTKSTRFVYAVGSMTLVASLALIPLSSRFDRQIHSAEIRLSTEEITEGSGRRDIWPAAIRVAEDSFFLGVGLGQYLNYHGQYVRQATRLYSPTILDHELGTHSEYINLLTGTGILGVGAYILWFTSIAGRFLRLTLKEHPADPLLTFGAASILMVGFFQATANSLISPHFHLMIFICLGIYYQHQSRMQTNDK